MTLDILIFAAIAVFLGWRLYSVFGQRIGHDRPVRPGSDKEITENKPLDTAQRAQPSPRALPMDLKGAAKDGVLAIQQAEPSFDPRTFLQGARAAYEMISTSFAKGDLPALQPLLSQDLYRQFEKVIKERENRAEKLDYHFIGITAAEIASAALEGEEAMVKVKFSAQHNQVLYDRMGAVIEGDLKQIDDISDLWTFRRKVNDPNPNWQLSATESL